MHLGFFLNTCIINASGFKQEINFFIQKKNTKNSRYSIGEILLIKTKRIIKRIKNINLAFKEVGIVQRLRKTI